MINLHTHSRYSDDGEFAPSKLIEQCAEKGICMAAPHKKRTSAKTVMPLKHWPRRKSF